MPDIDIDFCMRRRGEVIEYVRKNTAQKAWRRLSRLAPWLRKPCLKDAGRALDMPYGEVDRLAKMIPDTLKFRSRTR